MEIKWQFKGRYFALCIGYEVKWFAQINLITLSEEFYDGHKVVYAKMLFKCL
jgi:hypothetical protein